MDDVDIAVRQLKEAMAISEWHFRDAVEELLIAARKGEYSYGIDFEDWEG
ncbi:MAG: hypothetical protein OJF50_002503 [Nitrospira sp.]|jgi:hypothetical protein|nr:hypothetical protein [Nitrospira sp.]